MLLGFVSRAQDNGPLRRSLSAVAARYRGKMVVAWCDGEQHKARMLSLSFTLTLALTLTLTLALTLTLSLTLSLTLTTNPDRDQGAHALAGPARGSAAAARLQH